MGVTHSSIKVLNIAGLTPNSAHRQIRYSSLYIPNFIEFGWAFWEIQRVNKMNDYQKRCFPPAPSKRNLMNQIHLFILFTGFHRRFGHLTVGCSSSTLIAIAVTRLRHV